MGRGRRHLRLRAARRARVGRAPGAARRTLSLRVVDLGVHRCEPARDSTRRRRSACSRIRRREEIGKHYGPLKAACEDVVTRGLRRRARSTCGRASSSDRTIRPTASATGSRASCIRACSATAPPRRSCRCPRSGRCSSSTRATSRRSCSTSSRQGRGRHVQRDAARRAVDDRLRWSTRSSRQAARPRRAPRGRTRRCSSSTRSRRGPGCRCGFPTTFADEAGFMEIDCTQGAARGLAHATARRDDRRHRGVARAARQRGCVEGRAQRRRRA